MSSVVTNGLGAECHRHFDQKKQTNQKKKNIAALSLNNPNLIHFVAIVRVSQRTLILRLLAL